MITYIILTLPTAVESRIGDISWSICSFFFNTCYHSTKPTAEIYWTVYASQPSIAGLTNIVKRYLLACAVGIWIWIENIWIENAKLTIQTITADFCSTCEFYGEDLNLYSPFFFYSPKCQEVEGGWVYYIIIKRHKNE